MQEANEGKEEAKLVRDVSNCYSLSPGRRCGNVQMKMGPVQMRVFCSGRHDGRFGPCGRVVCSGTQHVCCMCGVDDEQNLHTRALR